MRSISTFCTLFLFVSFVCDTAILRSQEPSPDPAPATGPRIEEEEWLEFYYKNPTPDRFVSELKNWAQDGTLDNQHAKPALISFISQVIRQNPEKVKDWYVNLSGLTPEQMQIVHTGMLFSRTMEADEIMRGVFGKIYDEQKMETQKILEMPLDKESTMDMLWGYFYATGSEGAIRRIVTCFAFEDAPDKPPGVNVPDDYVPLYRILPGFARDSLIANAGRHPRVLEILKELYSKDETLTALEKEGIYGVLAEFDPKTYPPRVAVPKAE